MGDVINRILTTHVTPNCDSQNLVNNSINILSKQLCSSIATQQI